MKPLLLACLRAYQYALRPMLGANCRFYPSCSDYAREAIERHGVAPRNVARVAPRSAMSPVSSGRVRPGSLISSWKRPDSLMDTQRLILFVIFSFSALFLWEAWQREHRPPVPQVASPTTPTPAGIDAPTPSAAATAAVPGGAAPASVSSEKISIKTDLYTATVDTLGASSPMSRSQPTATHRTKPSLTCCCKEMPSGLSSRNRDCSARDCRTIARSGSRCPGRASWRPARTSSSSSCRPPPATATRSSRR